MFSSSSPGLVVASQSSTALSDGSNPGSTAALVPVVAAPAMGSSVGSSVGSSESGDANVAEESRALHCAAKLSSSFAAGAASIRRIAREKDGFAGAASSSSPVKHSVKP